MDESGLDCAVSFSDPGIYQAPVESEEKHAANIVLIASQSVWKIEIWCRGYQW